MKKSAGMLMAMAGMLAATGGMGMTRGPRRYDDPPKDRPYIPREKECPKGAKNYWFNKHGEFDNERMLKSETVFHCFARDDKNAKRKFNNFMKQQKNDL